jgi:hypothetical protein
MMVNYRPLVQIALLGVAVALGTLVLGWWVVPVIGMTWGLVARDRERPQLVVAMAAGLGWALLILWTATQGPVGQVARRAAGVMEMPGPMLALMTVLFAMAVAWSAAVVAGEMRRRET